MRRPTALLLTVSFACAQDPPPLGVVTRSDSFLLAATKIGLPPVVPSVDSLPEAESLGARSLVAFCGQCHAAPAPSFHSAGDWPIVLRRMWLRMDHLAPDYRVGVPSTGERHALLQYLQGHALAVADNLPDHPGRDTFVRVCSQCHALPDPRTHTTADWPVVFLRMRENMTRMHVSAPDQAETTAILAFLERSTIVPGSRR